MMSTVACRKDQRNYRDHFGMSRPMRLQLLFQITGFDGSLVKVSLEIWRSVPVTLSSGSCSVFVSNKLKSLNR